MFVACYFVGNITYSLCDAGLANVLGLQTLRHGTNLINNILIRIFGGNPTHGFKATGSTRGFYNEPTGRFYVFKDSEFGFKDIPIVPPQGLLNRVVPNLHTFISGWNLLAPIFPKWEKQSLLVKCMRIFVGIIGSIGSLIISPTIRFRFSQIDKNRFSNDHKYEGAAYVTEQKIEAWRIGILGTLLTGINLNWCARVKAHPRKFITGVVQLGVVAAIVALGVSILIANPLLIIPVAIGAMLS